MLRRLAERLSRGIVFRRHLPRRFNRVPFYVSPECGLRYYLPDMERIDPTLLDAAFSNTGANDVVWDVGANLGLFAFAAAAGGARVIAIEADCWLVELLRRSQRLNRLNVTVLPVAASGSVGFASFHIAERGRGSNFLRSFGRIPSGGTRFETTVPTVTLDSLLEHFPAPTVLKIDVEGAELDVLKGASKVLSHHPRLICEVGKDAAEDFAAIMRSNAYRMFDLDNHSQPIGMPAFSTLAIASNHA